MLIIKFKKFSYFIHLRASVNVLPNFSSSGITDDDPFDRFSSELLLFMLFGIAIPMGRSCLFGTASVRSYVVHPMPDDESVTISFEHLSRSRFCFNL